MQYIISFLEGIVTFLSPCLLPMLPVYISYFAGNNREGGMGRTLRNALGFVLGFTIVFIALGALAGTLGGLLQAHQTAVNLVTGAVVVLFGLYFLGVFRLNFLKGMKGFQRQKDLGFFFHHAVRNRFFCQLDALCGRVPGIGADAGVPSRGRP